MKTHRIRWGLILLFLVIVFCGHVYAAEISPALEDQLAKAGPDDFVSAIVILESPIDIMNLDFALHARKATLAERHREVIESLKYNAAQTQPAFKAELDAAKALGVVKGYTAYWIENLFVVYAGKQFIGSLRERSDVKAVTENFKAELVTPIESERPDPIGNSLDREVTIIGQRATRATEANHKLGLTGQGTLVANLDVGVRLGHPALSSQWRGNTEPVSECWLDLIGEIPLPDSEDPHGTHVMGIMCGREIRENDDTLTIGAAPDAQWIACNAILQDGYTEQFNNDIITAFEWFADPDGIGTTLDDVPDVINNSWGTSVYMPYPTCYDYWNTIITNCESAGPIIIFSSGNEGTPGSPAIYSLNQYQMFAVGNVDATNHDDPPYPLGHGSGNGLSPCDPEPFGIKPEVVAPGEDVYSSFSSYPDYLYGFMSGTSMAAPHVSGIAALLRQACPDCDYMTIKDAIMSTAIDDGYGEDGEDLVFGHGFVDAVAAAASIINIGDPSCTDPYLLLDGRVETRVLQTGTDIVAGPFNCLEDESQDSEGKDWAFKISVTGNTPFHVSLEAKYCEDENGMSLLLFQSCADGMSNCLDGSILSNGEATLDYENSSNGTVEYYIIVAALEPEDESLFSISYCTTIPEVPSGLTSASTVCVGSISEVCWEQIAGDVEYEIEVTPPQPSVPEILLSNNNCADIAIDEIGSWSWRVRGQNDCGYGEWSLPVTIAVDGDIPNAPELTTPEAILCTSEDYEFEWTSEAGASSYHLQYSSDAGQTVDYEISIIVTSYERQFTTVGHKVWRVASVSVCGNGQQKIWSDWQPFYVSDGQTTVTADQILPPNGGWLCEETGYDFSWPEFVDAESYVVEIQATNPPMRGTTFSTDYAGFYRIYDSEDPWAWQWRVRAIGPCGTAPWSAWFTFSVVPYVPAAPVLQTPSESEEICLSTAPIDLQWAVAEGANEYALQIAIPNEEIFSPPMTRGNFFEFNATKSGVHFWRVRSIGPCGESAYSEWSSFLIKDAPASTGFVLDPPYNGYVCDGIPYTFDWPDLEFAEGYFLEMRPFGQQLAEGYTLEESDYTRTFTLGDHNTWLWRVRGFGECGEPADNWTAWYWFTVSAIIPAVPMNLRPCSGTRVVPGSVVNLNWPEMQGANSYDIQVGSAPDNQIIAVNLKDPFYVHEVSGEDTVFWRVKSIGPCGNSDYSDWSILPVTGAVNSLVGSLEIGGSTVRLDWNPVHTALEYWVWSNTTAAELPMIEWTLEGITTDTFITDLTLTSIKFFRVQAEFAENPPPDAVAPNTVGGIRLNCPGSGTPGVSVLLALGLPFDFWERSDNGIPKHGVIATKPSAILGAQGTVGNSLYADRLNRQDNGQFAYRNDDGVWSGNLEYDSTAIAGRAFTFINKSGNDQYIYLLGEVNNSGGYGTLTVIAPTPPNTYALTHLSWRDSRAISVADLHLLEDGFIGGTSITSDRLLSQTEGSYAYFNTNTDLWTGLLTSVLPGKAYSILNRHSTPWDYTYNTSSSAAALMGPPEPVAVPIMTNPKAKPLMTRKILQK